MLLVAGISGAAVYIRENKRQDASTNRLGKTVAAVLFIIALILIVGKMFWQNSFKSNFDDQTKSNKFVIVKKEKVVAYRAFVDDLSEETPTNKIDSSVDTMLVKTASGEECQIKSDNSPEQTMTFRKHLTNTKGPEYEMTLLKATPRAKYKTSVGAHTSEVLVVTHNVQEQQIKD